MNRIRLAGRAVLAAVALSFVALIGLQCANIVARNVAVAREVAASRAELEALREKKREQLRTIARLGDPRGAIPEIHDRLHLVGPRRDDLRRGRAQPDAGSGERSLSGVRGVVINVHALGATVRLEDGSIAAVPAAEASAHAEALTRSLQRREALAFALDATGRHPVARVAESASPAELDANFEDRLNAYLKSTEEWAPPDRPEPAERHFFRKKRRAAHFEARSKPT